MRTEIWASFIYCCIPHTYNTCDTQLSELTAGSSSIIPVLTAPKLCFHIYSVASNCIASFPFAIQAYLPYYHFSISSCICLKPLLLFSSSLDIQECGNTTTRSAGFSEIQNFGCLISCSVFVLICLPYHLSSIGYQFIIFDLQTKRKIIIK